jgi:ferric-dicitrate binding protein FerR (iron transport regulator)
MPKNPHTKEKHLEAIRTIPNDSGCLTCWQADRIKELETQVAQLIEELAPYRDKPLESMRVEISYRPKSGQGWVLDV